MVLPLRQRLDELVEHLDHRVVLHGVSWAQYEVMLKAKGDNPIPRMTYLEGELELMSPSVDHEWIKVVIGRLIEAYAEELDLDLNGLGSTTYRRRAKQRGAEPDLCYALGRKHGAPDLAIEVAWTPSGLDKLDVYRQLGVKELWIWERGAITCYGLKGERYARQAKSRVLPGLDLALVARLVQLPSQREAVRTLRKALQDS
jgi:Uma2 family endonuclease